MTAGGARLLADIGGTNARFAVRTADGVVGPPTILPVAEFAGFADAMAAFLAKAGSAEFSGAAIAAAGPLDGDEIRLTNADWTIRAADIAAALPGAAVGLFNDLEAVALALPHLDAGDIDVLLPGKPAPADAPRLAVNVGTGFGAAIVVPGDGGWRALAGEAGHMRFAAATADERAMTHAVETYEDVLSGRGFARLRALILEPGRRKRAFSALLGRVAGDIALATGAWGGVYFCGGVLADWAENIDFETFAHWYFDKGPMRARMAALPTARVTRPAPALLGLAHAPL